MQRLSLPTCIPERPMFAGFDDCDTWRVPGYQRNLPHWRVDGGTYFITFRLADSIPEAVVRRWQDDHDRWLRMYGMEPGWEKTDPDRFRAAFAAVSEGERKAFEREMSRRYFVELDRCHGACLLREAATREVVSGALRHFHGLRVWLGDFVVMPNHVHVLVQPFPGVKLEEWLYSVKRFSGMRMTTSAGQTWQEESFDRLVRDDLELSRVRNYIARNPEKLRPDEYTLKQAGWLDEFTPGK